jgi:ABC-type multidrug transport system ATPase subunit
MKQRLAIALALLPGPKLLVLDEPTNGLDPAGIVELRKLIQRFNRERGITVLVSSHILPEVEKLATHVGIIAHGHLRFQGPLSELYALQPAGATLEDLFIDLTSRHYEPASLPAF